MKKFSTLLVAVFVSLCTTAAIAAELNIYASGLNATQDGNNLSIDYILNAPATALELQLLNDDGTVAHAIPITGEANLTKGKHTQVSIYLSE